MYIDEHFLIRFSIYAKSRGATCYIQILRGAGTSSHLFILCYIVFLHFISRGALEWAGGQVPSLTPSVWNPDHNYVAFCNFTILLIAQKLENLETWDWFYWWSMRPSKTYFIPRSIGHRTSEQFSVKDFVASSSPNFNDKCLLELKF